MTPRMSIQSLCYLQQRTLHVQFVPWLKVSAIQRQRSSHLQSTPSFFGFPFQIFIWVGENEMIIIDHLQESNHITGDWKHVNLCGNSLLASSIGWISLELHYWPGLLDAWLHTLLVASSDTFGNVSYWCSKFLSVHHTRPDRLANASYNSVTQDAFQNKPKGNNFKLCRGFIFILRI